MRPCLCCIMLGLLCATTQAAEDVVVQVPDIAPATNAPAVTPPPATNAPVPVATNAVAPVMPAVDFKKLPAGTVFTVQLGAFKTRERAFAAYWDLSKKVSPLQLTSPSEKDKMYRVRHGSYPSFDEAKAAAEKLKKAGIECFVAPAGMPELATNEPQEEK